ncbi:MAG: nickel pincer cofactor biosynthesis protein LarC [Coriobacteriales bacterium]|nr:nickel pincer cofactor biosynthesis protein LarC [Coriobacteriales bacterium]
MIAHVDLASGASGDKLVAALLDAAEQLGCYSLEQLQCDLHGFEPALQVERDRVTNGGIAAWQVKMIDRHTGREADAPCALSAAGPEHDGPHDHHHGRFHEHRHATGHSHVHWSDIKAHLEQSDLPSRARDLAIAIFSRVAAAESQVHGTSLEEVAFHEVGALDSIGDIVSCALVVDALSREEPLRLIATPIALGSGTVRAAHGILPVPAPATALLVKGLPVVSGGAATELTTPTGAAVIAELAGGFGPLPPMVPLAIGLGAGTKVLEGMPNVLRVIVGRPVDAAGLDAAARTDGSDHAGGALADDLPVEEVVLLDCNLDHLSGEAAADACRRLLAAGALDVWQEPIAMKKGRLGINLNVLAAPLDADRLAELTHRLTGTLGLRRRSVLRTVARRSYDTARTSWGLVRFKSMLAGDREHPDRLWLRAEADDVSALAAREDVSFSQMASALHAEGKAAFGVANRDCVNGDSI